MSAFPATAASFPACRSSRTRTTPTTTDRITLTSTATAAHHHIGELIARIDRAPLSSSVRERAVRAFRLLGEAEGRIHGVPADQVALHEVGAADAMVDIVGALEGFERLGVSRVYNWPVTVGAGWVRAAHGVIPVPAPATAVLLEGIELGPNGPVTGEATTPTGAVLLRVLSAGAPPARWRPVSAGAWGAGGRNPSAYPNALRLILAESVAEAGEVVLLSTDVDDLSPEYLDPLREALFAAGALDVQVWATQMKKGRAGFPNRDHGGSRRGRSGVGEPVPAQHDGRYSPPDRRARHLAAQRAAARCRGRDARAGKGVGRTRTALG